MVGVGTILADDPLLTDRSELPRRRPLLRIVLDSTLRTPLDSQLVKTAYQDVLIFFSHAERRGAEGARSARRSPAADRASRPAHSLAGRTGAPGRNADHQPAARRRRGGLYHALNQGLVDKLMLFYAPRFLGQDGGAHALARSTDCRQIENYSLKQFGQDFAFEAYLHDPWSEVI